MSTYFDLEQNVRPLCNVFDGDMALHKSCSQTFLVADQRLPSSLRVHDARMDFGSFLIDNQEPRFRNERTYSMRCLED